MPSCFVRVPVVQDIEGVPETPGTPFNFPVEGAYLPFYFTNQSFTRVLSALVNGAKLTYGEEAYQVIWDFLQNVEYPVSLCDQIAECINTNETTQQAIRNFVTTDITINQHIQNISRGGQPMPEVELPTPIVSQCDPDEAWAAIDAIVEQMNTNNMDFFQVFETSTNQLERVSDLLAAIPLFETLPVDDVVAFVDQLFDNIYEAYEGAVTTELLNEYKCDLFCIGTNDPDCELGFDVMYNYFRDRIAATFTIESLFQEAIEFLGDGTFPGTLVADFMYMLQLQVIRSASDFLGVNVLSLQVVAQVGALVPSSAWELLCEDCTPSTCDGDDLITSADGWEPLDGPDYSIWHDGEGYGPGTTTPQRIGVKKSYVTLISKITVTFNMPTTGTMDVGTFTYGYPPAFGSIVHGAPATTWELEFTASTAGIAIDYRVGVLDPIPAGLRIICIKVE